VGGQASQLMIDEWRMKNPPLFPTRNKWRLRQGKKSFSIAPVGGQAYGLTIVDRRRAKLKKDEET